MSPVIMQILMVHSFVIQAVLVTTLDIMALIVLCILYLFVLKNNILFPLCLCHCKLHRILCLKHDIIKATFQCIVVHSQSMAVFLVSNKIRTNSGIR